MQSGVIAGGLADGRILVWDAGKFVGSPAGSPEPVDITKQDKSGGSVSACLYLTIPHGWHPGDCITCCLKVGHEVRTVSGAGQDWCCISDNHCVQMFSPLLHRCKACGMEMVVLAAGTAEGGEVGQGGGVQLICALV